MHRPGIELATARSQVRRARPTKYPPSLHTLRRFVTCYSNLQVNWWSAQRNVYAVSCAGNRALSALLAGEQYALRVELEDWEGNKAYAEYEDFKVEGRGKKYRLKSVGSYSGNAGGCDVKTSNTCFCW